jgi:ZIP family zinc transporter
VEWFAGLSPIQQAFVAGMFTWALTAAGAALVLGTRTVSPRFLAVMLGFAAGVMLAASYWSLLAPAIEMAESQGVRGWIPALVGLLTGAAFLRIADAWLPHLHPGYPMKSAEGVRTSWERATLLVLAITLHNIPEGLAVGVAFGALGATTGAEYTGSLGAAIALAIGIGLQNFPEGIAVAMPLRGEGVSAAKSFWYGQLSAIVEPVAAVIGAAAVLTFQPLLPYALAFAAGAMIYVVVEELIPESQITGHSDTATVATIGGFAVMMVLDVALG